MSINPENLPHVQFDFGATYPADMSVINYMHDWYCKLRIVNSHCQEVSFKSSSVIENFL